MKNDIKYLKLLSEKYPNYRKASEQLIKLKSLMYLPKGTEYFFSDLHGESGSFVHLLRSASGNIRDKISQLFVKMEKDEQDELASLVYSPGNYIRSLKKNGKVDDDFYKKTISNLVELFRYVSTKYPKETVKRKLSGEYNQILDDLLYVNNKEYNKRRYYDAVIDGIIEVGLGEDFVISLSHIIQRISVERVHIVGDIFDRGPNPHIIMDELISFSEVDFQWGNHDIERMGAVCGNEALIATVLCNSLQYNNLDLLEDGYNINLRPLYEFALTTYKDDPCEVFIPRIFDENEYDNIDKVSVAKMFKAISIIRYKLTGQIINRHPEYNVDDRNVLLKINYNNMTFKGENLKDTNFPTIDPKNPLKLTYEEENLMHHLVISFKHSKKLLKHIKFIYTRGSAYKIFNSNLLFHGCIPMNENEEFETIKFNGKSYSGKSLMDFFDTLIRKAFYAPEDDPHKKDYIDFMWYARSGPKSPMFGKSQFSAFENLFVEKKELREEKYNPYYELSKREDICDKIFDEFSLNYETSHIINGHVPVKIKNGEKPVRANGKLYVIDGGIAKPYQKKTGIAGYTMFFNSHHIALVEHHNFYDLQDKIGSYNPNIEITEVMKKRRLVKDTDNGKIYSEKINDLKELLEAYDKGILKQSQN
ncbi:MAG: fructose-1,6-bisphosphatase [Peptoniphilaceae bacterium]|nr:fructose-1,6-bisphosphatase [Peptoniphilaceae bacterium]MDD7383236.1 fructose-1,6-bisphosphatase [Peptoniphilaceae bacterium]MDY3737618.1 fructose-1,6-bisphosphatase [Peptoniphilaceae bacterium]